MTALLGGGLNISDRALRAIACATLLSSDWSPVATKNYAGVQLLRAGLTSCGE